MHYRISYNINVYYHVYIGNNINGDDALAVVNSERCKRFLKTPENAIIEHDDTFPQLNDINSFASIFMKSDSAIQPDGISHVYVDAGNSEDAATTMINYLNNINNDGNPAIIQI